VRNLLWSELGVILSYLAALIYAAYYGLFVGMFE
jgi:hypothetical protein